MMYTSSDIRNVEFTKSMGGYKAAEVEAFIERCAETVDALTAENEELNKKMSILADKLVEYRRDEDSIRSALLSAQRLGDSVVRDANQKADNVIAEANQKAGAIVETAKQDVRKYQAELERAKQEVGDFKAKMLSLYKDHLSLLKTIPDGTVSSAAPTAPIVHAVPVTPAAPAAPVAAPAVQAVPATQEDVNDDEDIKTETPKSKFANLKFGEDYDIGDDKDE